MAPHCGAEMRAVQMFPVGQLRFPVGISPGFGGHHFVIARATGSSEKNYPFVFGCPIAPPYPLCIQSWYEDFEPTVGLINIEARGGRGGAGEDRFFRSTRGPLEDRFFRSRNDENKTTVVERREPR